MTFLSELAYWLTIFGISAYSFGIIIIFLGFITLPPEEHKKEKLTTHLLVKTMILIILFAIYSTFWGGN